MAFIEDIAVRIGLDASGLRAGVRQVLRDLNSIKRAASGIGDGFNRIGDGLRTATGVVTALTGATVAGATALYSLATAGAEAADQTGKLAAQAGLTTSQFSQLAFAFEQGGVSAEEFVGTMRFLNKTIAAGLAGEKNAVALFNALGVKLKDGRGRFVGQAVVLGQMAEIFKRIPNGITKSTIATALFGKTGARLIPTLNEGVIGLRELSQQAVDLGVAFTEADAVLGDEVGDATDRAAAGFRGLRNQLALALGPDVIALANQLTQALIRNRAVVVDLAVRGFNFVRQSVLDLFHAFRGEDAEVVQQWPIRLRDGIFAVIEGVRNLFNNVIIPIVDQLTGLFERLAAGINEAFGTKLSGAEVAFAAFALKITGGLDIIVGGFIALAFFANAAVVAVALLGRVLLALVAPVVIAGLKLIGGLLLTAVTALAAIVGWPALIVAGITIAAVAIVGFWDDIKSGAQSAVDFIGRQVDRFVALWQAAKEKVGSFFGAAGITPQQSGGLGSNPERFHAGGLVRGKAGRDKNLILAERDEFVMRGAAVRKFGTQFMDAINSGNLPRFHEGGPVGDTRPVTLNLPGGGSFALAGPADVVGSLERYVRAGTRRTPTTSPSWKR